jgi:hypothetical protein
VSWVLALAGWAAALAAFIRLRRQLAVVADAEHELRGAATVIALAFERMPGSRYADLLQLQLDRLRAALDDLAPWRGGSRADPRAVRAGRRAQLIGNLLANATEHGAGPVDVMSTRLPSGVRVEIRNRNRGREPRRSAAGRGRGLAIAARAAREIGGSLRVESRDGETVATIELPEGKPAASELGRAE